MCCIDPNQTITRIFFGYPSMKAFVAQQNKNLPKIQVTTISYIFTIPKSTSCHFKKYSIHLGIISINLCPIQRSQAERKMFKASSFVTPRDIHKILNMNFLYLARRRSKITDKIYGRRNEIWSCVLNLKFSDKRGLGGILSKKFF